MRVIPPDGIPGRDLPAFSGGTGKFEQAARLGIPEGRRMPRLRRGTIHCPGRRIEIQENLENDSAKAAS